MVLLRIKTGNHFQFVLMQIHRQTDRQTDSVEGEFSRCRDERALKFAINRHHSTQFKKGTSDNVFVVATWGLSDAILVFVLNVSLPIFIALSWIGKPQNKEIKR